MRSIKQDFVNMNLSLWNFPADGEGSLKHGLSYMIWDLFYQQSQQFEVIHHEICQIC